MALVVWETDTPVGEGGGWVCACGVVPTAHAGMGGVERWALSLPGAVGEVHGRRQGE